MRILLNFFYKAKTAKKKKSNNVKMEKDKRESYYLYPFFFFFYLSWYNKAMLEWPDSLPPPPHQGSVLGLWATVLIGEL